MKYKLLITFAALAATALIAQLPTGAVGMVWSGATISGTPTAHDVRAADRVIAAWNNQDEDVGNDLPFGNNAQRKSSLETIMDSLNQRRWDAEVEKSFRQWEASNPAPDVKGAYLAALERGVSQASIQTALDALTP